MFVRRIFAALWLLFLAWSAMTIAISASFYRLAGVPGWIVWIDFIFYLLAAIHTCWLVASHAGWSRTWLSCCGVLLASGLAHWLNARNGVLFGPLTYLPGMGPWLDRSLPLALPLLWWTLIGNCYLLYRYLLPVFDARIIALLTAVSVMLFDFLLEPFASHKKFYWWWHNASAPWQNYVFWLLLAFALTRFLPLRGQQAPTDYRRPLMIIAILVLLCLTARLS